MKIEDEKEPAASVISEIWKTTSGKIAVLAVGGLALTGFAGLSFIVFAYTMNKYKDFRDAWRR